MPDDLYIQYQNADSGGAIVPCSDYWLSPSIWLSGDAIDASTAKAADNPADPAAGAFENLLNVKVHSKSPNEKTVHVQVWPSNYLIAAAPAGMLPGVPLIGFTSSVDGVRKGAPGQV